MRPKLLIFIVAYHAESTITNVLTRIPHSLNEQYDTEVLIIDDASADGTFEQGHEIERQTPLPFRLVILRNPVNQGYGGNQKLGYFYAAKNDFDFVVLLHGDGQYAPECLPDLVSPLSSGKADACFGSRMMIRGGALHGGMPLYKFIGNKILSWFENRLLHTTLSEFHSGYRAYTVAALRRIPFGLNTNDFHFDTEIIVQLVRSGLRIVEVPIPTRYGDEICYVNGMQYAWNVTRSVIKARLQEVGLFYDPRFDCVTQDNENKHYLPKLDYPSSHSFALEEVAAASSVLDLGCAGGYMGATLKQRKDCRVTGVDIHPPGRNAELDRFYRHDLDEGPPDISPDEYNVILLLDVIEHLSSPESFLRRLRELFGASPDVKIIISTGNIAFVVTRLMLMLGQFNYGKRGILDMTHTRLFTFSSLRRLLEQSGFRVSKVRGVPAPFPLALSSRTIGMALLRINQFFIRISKRLFSYQILLIAHPNPSVDYLLRSAEEHSAERRFRQKAGADAHPLAAVGT